MDIEIQLKQDTLRIDGIVLFSYRIEYPFCAQAPRFCAFWEDFAKETEARARAFGADYGKKRLEAYLAAGGKRSRFSCPRLVCRCHTQMQKEGLCVALHTRLTERTEVLWEHREGRLWDVALGICGYKKGNCR